MVLEVSGWLIGLTLSTPRASPTRSGSRARVCCGWTYVLPKSDGDRCRRAGPLEPLRDPAGDALAHSLLRVLRVSIRGHRSPGSEHAGLGVVDHDRGCWRAAWRHARTLISRMASEPQLRLSAVETWNNAESSDSRVPTFSFSRSRAQGVHDVSSRVLERGVEAEDEHQALSEMSRSRPPPRSRANHLLGERPDERDVENGPQRRAR